MRQPKLHYGVAREIALKTGRKLKELSIKKATKKALDIHDIATVKIANKNDCPRYMGAVLENVSVGSAPEWMVGRLKAAGQRVHQAVVRGLVGEIAIDLGIADEVGDVDEFLVPVRTLRRANIVCSHAFLGLVRACHARSSMATHSCNPGPT